MPKPTTGRTLSVRVELFLQARVSRRTEESHEVRKTTDSEGNLHIASGVRLSDFFDTAQGQRAFRNSR